MKKISSFIRNNFIWKLSSFCIATMLWFIGMNLYNPTINHTISLSLSLENSDRVAANKLVLLNEDELLSTTIDVRLRVNRSDLTNILNEQRNIKALVDLGPVDLSYADKVGQPISSVVEIDIPAYIDAPSMEIISVSPYTVNVVLDNLVSRNIPVTVDRLGEAQKEFMAMQPLLEPDSVGVSGAKSIVDKIDSVKVQVNLRDAVDDVVVYAMPVVYDAENKNITNKLTLNTVEILVTVPVNQFVRLPLIPTYKGNVAEGYRVASAIVKPEFVEVFGEQEDLETIKRITLDPIHVDGATESITETFDIRNYLVNTSLTIRNGTTNEADVTVNIIKEMYKELYVPLEKLRILGFTTSVELLSTELYVVIKGPERLVETITEDNIVGTVNLTSLPPGQHEAQVYFDLPGGVSVFGETATISVIISAPDGDGENLENKVGAIIGTTTEDDPLQGDSLQENQNTGQDEQDASDNSGT